MAATSHQAGSAVLNRASAMKMELLAQIEQLGAALPPNSLDELFDKLGGPDKVAEITGRKGRVVQDENGHVNIKLEQIKIAFLMGYLFIVRI